MSQSSIFAQKLKKNELININIHYDERGLCILYFKLLSCHSKYSLEDQMCINLSENLGNLAFLKMKVCVCDLFEKDLRL